MLENIFFRGLNTKRWLLTTVLLVLGVPWLTRARLTFVSTILMLDIREIRSHACYSWVLYLRLFRGFDPCLVTYPRGLCVHACSRGFMLRLVIYPRGLRVHACFPFC